MFIKVTRSGSRRYEAAWNNLRLIIAHDPQVALDAGAKRDNRIQALEQQAAE